MATTNQDWYVENQSRAYPLADDVSTQLIPSNLICDLRLFVTEQAADVKFFIHSVFKSQTWISIVIAKQTGGNEYVLTTLGKAIGAIDLYRPYPLESVLPEECLSGFIVFGSGLYRSETLNVRPGVTNGLLAASSLIVGFVPPVKSVGVSGLDRQSMSGPVTLVLEPPLEYEIAKQGEVTYVRLILVQEQEVLEEYAGRCGRRLQNGNCTVPPIETINGVSPDCDNQITVEFVGCVEARFTGLLDETNEDNLSLGAIIECGIEIGDICTPGTIDPSGDLNNGQNQCEG